MSNCSPSQRIRKHRRRTAERTVWYRAYRQRIADGLERCRNCQRHHGGQVRLTFDHLVPHSRGGRLRFDNVTILCGECNVRKGDQEWAHLRSLAEEEAAAPSGRRWSEQRHSPKWRHGDGSKSVSS